MFFKSPGFLLAFAVAMGIVVQLLPRPEGTRFSISGDPGKALYAGVNEYFALDPAETQGKAYVLRVKEGNAVPLPGVFLQDRIEAMDLSDVRVKYLEGLSPTAKRFLAILAALVVLFVTEPIPLTITALLIGVCLTAFNVTDLKNAWAAYMHPVVVFIMACMIFAIAVDKVGLTRRLGYAIVRRAGTSVVRFTFFISIGLGLASSVMHDAAACAIGIAVMLPLMKAAGIQPHTNTAKFMMISLPFACSCGGMGTLVGGGRCMASAAFLKEFTDGRYDLSFANWTLYCMPAAVICMVVAVSLLYFVFRPDAALAMPKCDEDLGPFSRKEKATLIVTGLMLAAWLTKGFHGLDYSITGMIGVAALVLFGILKWDDIHENLEWGTALFIFGGGISLGLAMESSGAAQYLAHLFFPLVAGKGWLVLFIGVAVFAALATNVMANVAVAALALPIAIPLAEMENINPTIIALCLGMAASFSFLMVIGCPPNAMCYSYRQFKSSDLTRSGAIVTPVLLGVLTLVSVVWWKILGLV